MPRPQVQIRRYQVSDAAVVWKAVRESLAELTPWMAWCHEGYAVEETAAWLETQVVAFDAGTAFEFAIVSAGGAYLGGCGLNQLDRPNRRANLGYWVRSSEAGKGVASSAARLVVSWAFAHTSLNRIEILAATGNAASQRVAARAGGRREGVLRSRLLVRDTWQDAVLFSILRDDVAAHPGDG